MRLIYANDVKRRGCCYPPDVRKVISNILSHTKTVKDALVVVRCEDCEHRNGDYCHKYRDGYTAFIHHDDYCSYAERRTDG